MKLPRHLTLINISSSRRNLNPFFATPTFSSSRKFFFFGSYAFMFRLSYNLSRVMDQATDYRSKDSGDMNSSEGSKRYSDYIIPRLLNLYGERPRAGDFEIYADNATFEDPLMRAHGVKQIKSAFYTIPKVFSESGIVEYTVKEEIISPGKNEILIDNKQHYKFWGRNIDMISLIVLSLEDGKVVRHEDRWDKKPLRSRENMPVFGRLLEMSRRGSMLATHVIMGFGKDPFN